ncbi:hypothetical protein F511_17591 [Dorcoceras hygrometricum]|uniref:Uncharacterized protein n=1 Tax=Dorcoceras hygrometricum TaxID=472368 RepID=A0A2Z7APP9_9LAMI|nr:hypothetical protein F511_17591 [Dorcoceras hygrometricum]
MTEASREEILTCQKPYDDVSSATSFWIALVTLRSVAGVSFVLLKKLLGISSSALHCSRYCQQFAISVLNQISRTLFVVIVAQKYKGIQVLQLVEGLTQLVVPPEVVEYPSSA